MITGVCSNTLSQIDMMTGFTATNEVSLWKYEIGGVCHSIMMNVMDFDTVFSDLTDRFSFIRLKKPAVRKSKHELEAKFDTIRPKMLGASLDAVFMVLRNTNCRLDRDINC